MSDRLTERVILQDLIAELRAYADEGYIILQDLIAECSMHRGEPRLQPLVWMLNRAERRLREIGGDNDDE